MRSVWVSPGKGAPLRWLCYMTGVPTPNVTDAQLDERTSLYVHEDGEFEQKDVDRVIEVVRRVVLRGEDAGY